MPLPDLPRGGNRFSATAPLALVLVAALALGTVSGCGPDRGTASRAQGDSLAAATQALAELRRIGPLAATDPAALSQLGVAIRDPRPEVSNQAAYWLAKAGPIAVPVLIRVLADPSPPVRTAGCYALGLIAREASPAVPALLQQLAGDDDATANMADWALSQIAPSGRVPLLAEVRALRYGGEFERADAAGRLVLLGGLSTDAIPILVRALGDSSGLVAESAGDALVRIGSRAAPALQRALSSENRLVRARALLALNRIRPYSHF